MSYTVTGTTPDGIAYGVTVGGDDPGSRPSRGVVVGSPVALDLLADADGTDVEATPTGPLVRVDINDADTILPALMGLTKVLTTDGEVPEVHEPEVPGAVY